MRHPAKILGFILFCGAGGITAQTPGPASGSTSGRTEQIAAWLTPDPIPAAPPLTDRAAWEAFEKKVGAGLLAEAEKLLPEDPPPLPDELYLSRKGTMREYGVPYGQRRSRLALFVLAEGITNQGKYVKAVERELKAIFSEKTWSMPPHDLDLRKFKGELEDVDLGVAMRAAGVSTAVSILKEQLPAEIQDEAVRQLRRRAIGPYQQLIRGQNKSLCTWTKKTNNWNAVCHAGILLSALQTLPDANERAEIVAGAEKLLSNYWDGFTADGYCSEGIGYWNYGFGHFVFAAETVLRATDGKLDWYQGGKVKQAACFPERMEMAGNVFPSIGDCVLNPRPASWIRAICRQRLFSGKGEQVTVPATFSSTRPILLYDLVITGFPLFPQKNPAPGTAVKLDPLRGWFPEAGVLVARPAGENPSSLSVTLKGGNNGEHHNHNDVGQFVVGVRGQLPLLDPGIDVYTQETFGPRRYENDMLNSHGHAVPVVAGKLQKTGKSASARIVKSEFSPDQDHLTLDLSAVYDVPALQRLEREFVYSRENQCALTVTDHFSFTRPETFESALITYGTVTRESPDTLLIGGENKTGAQVRVKIDTGGLPFEVRQTTVKATRPNPPTRIAVALTGKAATGSLSLHVTPAGEPEP